LRVRILKSLVVYLIASCLFFYCLDPLMPLILRPVGRLVSIAPAETFLVYIHLTLLGGFFAASPYIFYHIWGFIAVALKPEEKKYAGAFGIFSILFFLAGAAFGLFFVMPIGLRFLLGFSTGDIVPMISVRHYISFVGTLTLSFGAVFEMPIAVTFLTAAGIVTPRVLAEYRRFAILGIFIVAAFLTPPDVVTQILLAVPMIALYEISLMASRWICRKRVDRTD